MRRRCHCRPLYRLLSATVGHSRPQSDFLRSTTVHDLHALNPLEVRVIHEPIVGHLRWQIMCVANRTTRVESAQ